MFIHNIRKSFVNLTFEKKYFFWLSIVLIHIFFFSLQVKNNNLYMVDSYEYLKMAENIKEDFYFYCGDKEEPFNPDLLTKRPPLYPLFILIAKFINKSDFLLIFFQSILSLLNIFILVKLAEKFKVNNYILILVLLIFTPVQFIYTNFVMSEILFQTFLILVFFHIVLFFEERDIKYIIFYNVFLILAMLTKPVLYLFVIPSFLFLIYITYKNKDFKPVLTGLIPIVFILSYCGWNYHRTGYFHYSSIQKTNLINYNAYYFLMNSRGEEYANKTIEEIDKETERLSSYKEKSQYIKKQTLNILIKENFLKYSVFHLRGGINFLVDPGRFDLQNYFGFKDSKTKGLLYHYSKYGYRGVFSYLKEQSVFFVLALIIILFFNLFKFLGLVLFFANKKVKIERRILIFILVGYIILATGPSGASRFAVPLLPIVIFACLNSWNKITSNLYKFS